MKTYFKEINGQKVFFDGILRFNDKQIINPTEECLKKCGWQEYIVEQSEIHQSYEDLVEQFIREKYSINQELAIQRQRDVKLDEFQEYFEYCEYCKQRAKDRYDIRNT